MVPQVFYEFWVASTRPLAQNGLGLDSPAATREMEEFEKAFAFVNDVPRLFDEWRRLVRTREVKGKSAHDARLVAAMLTHGIETLLTFNKADFTRYPGIA